MVYKEFTLVSSKEIIVDFDVGDQFFAVLTKNGKVFTFGDKKNGKLGVRHSKKNKFSEVKIQDTITQVHCGYSHTIVVGEKAVRGWGSNLNK